MCSIDSLPVKVTESERAVLEAEEELKAAELALVTARAGGSVDNLTRKWESYDIDENLERTESGKAAAISVLAGTVASVPFYLTGGGLGLGSLLSVGGVAVSCALFGLTYRYILRRDLGNIQLKSGAAAAFALVRGKMISISLCFPLSSHLLLLPSIYPFVSVLSEPLLSP